MKKILYFDDVNKYYLNFFHNFSNRYLIAQALSYSDVYRLINDFDILIINPKIYDKNYLPFLDNIIKNYKIELIVAISAFDSSLIKDVLAKHQVFNFLNVNYHKEELQRILEGENTSELYNKVCKSLLENGIKSSLKGFRYLADIIYDCIKDIKLLSNMQNLYQREATKRNVSSSSIERNIRTCVNEYNRLNSDGLTNSSYNSKIVNIYL